MDMKMFFLAKSLSHIVCHHFQLMKNINRSIPSIQDIRSIQERKAAWDEPIQMVQLSPKRRGDNFWCVEILDIGYTNSIGFVEIFLNKRWLLQVLFLKLNPYRHQTLLF